MYCKQCGNLLEIGSERCPKCNTKVGKGQRYCPSCGSLRKQGNDTCYHCGMSFIENKKMAEVRFEPVGNPPIEIVVEGNSPPEEGGARPKEDVQLPQEDYSPVQSIPVEDPAGKAGSELSSTKQSVDIKPLIPEESEKLNTTAMQEQSETPFLDVPQEVSKKSEPTDISEQPIGDSELIHDVEPLLDEQPSELSEGEGQGTEEEQAPLYNEQNFSPIMKKILQDKVYKEQTGNQSAAELLGTVPDPIDSTDYLNLYNKQTQDRKDRIKEQQEKEKAEVERKRELEARRNGSAVKDKSRTQKNEDKDGIKGSHEDSKRERREKKEADAAVKRAAKEKKAQEKKAARDARSQMSDATAVNSEVPSNAQSGPVRNSVGKRYKLSDAAGIVGFVLTACSIFNIFNVAQNQMIFVIAGFCTTVGFLSSLVGCKGEFGFLAKAGIALSIVSGVCLAAPFILAKTGF